MCAARRSISSTPANSRLALSDNNTEFRGALQTDGKFQINDFWDWGWSGTLQSDNIFLRTYDLVNGTEVRDQLFLTGQSANNWFDGRFIHYQVFTESRKSDNALQPVIHPVADYNYIFGESVLGGRLSLDSNILSLTRTDAEFLPLYPFATAKIPDPNNPGKNDPRTPSTVPIRPSTISTGLPNAKKVARVTPLACELVGAPGSSTRLISELHWERTFTDSFGQVFKPFALVRGDLYGLSVDDPYVEGGFATQPVIDQFLPGGSQTIVRGMAALGLEYRYPILISDDWGYQVIEPIAQIVARPDAQDNDTIPNNDALSMVFDDTNLFQLDKFSGYDRMEGRHAGQSRRSLQHEDQYRRQCRRASFGSVLSACRHQPVPDGVRPGDRPLRLCRRLVLLADPLVADRQPDPSR